MKAIIRTLGKVTTIGVNNVSVDIAAKTIQIEVLNPIATFNLLHNSGFDVELQGCILIVRADNITCTE